MKRLWRLLLLLPLLLVSGLSQQSASPPGFASVTFAWDASTDPSAIGYRLYWGGSSGNYTNAIDVGSLTLCTVTNVPVNVLLFYAATCYTASGLESRYSNEISYAAKPKDAALTLRYTLPPTNGPPVRQVIQIPLKASQ